jgi:hypothetical protein
VPRSRSCRRCPYSRTRPEWTATRPIRERCPAPTPARGIEFIASRPKGRSMAGRLGSRGPESPGRPGYCTGIGHAKCTGSRDDGVPTRKVPPGGRQGHQCRPALFNADHLYPDKLRSSHPRGFIDHDRHTDRTRERRPARHANPARCGPSRPHAHPPFRLARLAVAAKTGGGGELGSSSSPASAVTARTIVGCPVPAAFVRPWPVASVRPNMRLDLLFPRFSPRIPLEDLRQGAYLSLGNP